MEFERIVLVVIVCGQLAHAAPTDPVEFRRDALAEHNYIRSLHGVPPIQLSTNLNQIAQEYANKLANKRTSLKLSYNHYKGVVLGENLAFGNPIYSGKYVTDNWYAGYEKYFAVKPQPYDAIVFMFTQLVWKSTREVGFGIAQSYDGVYHIVANYYPPGNTIGKFDENVFNRKNGTTVQIPSKLLA